MYTSFLGFKNENIKKIKKTLTDFIGNYANSGPIPKSSLDSQFFLNQNLRIFIFLKFRTRFVLSFLKLISFLKKWKNLKQVFVY